MAADPEGMHRNRRPMLRTCVSYRRKGGPWPDCRSARTRPRGKSRSGLKPTREDGATTSWSARSVRPGAAKASIVCSLSVPCASKKKRQMPSPKSIGALCSWTSSTSPTFGPTANLRISPGLLRRFLPGIAGAECQRVGVTSAGRHGGETRLSVLRFHRRVNSAHGI